MHTPFFSIIIPVYNGSKTIKNITTNILNQTYQDFELILIDDGSTDNTLNILRGVKNRNKQIIIRSQENRGPSSARNTGLQKATGRYVVFFDADDNIELNALEVIRKKLLETKCDLLVAGWHTIDTIKTSRHTSLTPRLIENGNINNYVFKSLGNDNLLYNLWNKVFSNEIIKNNGLKFREDIRFGEDIVFILHYINYVSRFRVIAESLYHYHIGVEGSVFSTSALNPEYRRINNDELDNFVGENHDRETSELTEWIKWRWLLSYYRIVASSDLPRNKKLELIRENSRNRPKVAKNSRYIGKKKLALEHLGKTLVRSPRAALLFGSSAQAAKNTIIRIRS